MRTYIRSHAKGGVYFFTVNLAQRKQNDLLVRRVDDLRQAFRYTKQRHPLVIEAIAILPEHLHCIWRLPEGDDDYPMRWRLIKSHFSRSIEKGERVSGSRLRNKERGLWQRRYWEHQIRDDRDFQRHFEYIHYNPVKHGLVTKVKEWPFSSFHRWVKLGIYSEDWAAAPDLIEQDWE
ncbi:REP-associated tyrosine transposase [Methylomarinum vadi]|uniref:REP-associated tyrosine transposase n=1 Tax=Methylomarinum vadi TaxID=438855 RepID=UPI0004DF1F2C|nr:transposase [Methylomarinum vadi]